ADGDLLGEGAYAVGYEVDGVALEWIDGRPVPTHEDGAPDSLQILATAPARLMSITDDVCEPPPLLWEDTSPPGELEELAFALFGDMSDESVARIARGHAVMATFTKGAGEVFNAGSADWAYGLDGHPLVQRVTANVLRRFGV
ncbi:MAG: N,N-dimethylformamidase beta subunit family domain-containing protein, partial [Actinomycetota bacterium]